MPQPKSIFQAYRRRSDLDTAFVQVLQCFLWAGTLTWLSSPTFVVAELAMLEEVDVCSGFDPERGHWGWTAIAGAEQEYALCPPNSVFMAARNGSGPRRPLSYFELRGSCCPLPEGILSETHVFALEHCPEAHVVTGVRQHIEEPARVERRPDALHARTESEQLEYFPYARRFSLRCTEINHERVELSEPRGGMFIGWYRHLRSYLEPRSSRGRLPLELRYGLGRTSHYSWAHSFCVGYPWGSVLLSKGKKRCSEFQFAELRYRGAAGDPPAGTAVFQTSRCLYLEDEVGTMPRCMALKE